LQTTAPTTLHTRPTPADLAATAGQLESVIADGEPEQAKALLRILIAELRVNGRHDIQPTYRIITPDRAHTAGVCATSEKVGRAGIEPATLGLRGRWRVADTPKYGRFWQPTCP
jgi:hypothetical protein